MAVVTEHHSKEEWEGDDSEGSRVSLQVARDTVHVDNELKGEGDIIGLEVGRRVQSVELVVVVTVGLEFRGLEIIEFARNVSLQLVRSPQKADESRLAHSHLVQGSVNSLFFND